MPKTTVVVCNVMRRRILVVDRLHSAPDDSDAKTNFAIHNYLPELRQRQNRNDAD
jgi:hypothetical protein